MSKYVNESAAAKSLRVYTISKAGRPIASVLAHFTQSRVLVNVQHWRGAKGFQEFQHSSASGYGYDKFTAALSGLTIDGHAMTDHCGERRKPPRGRRFFPADYKPPRGYSLANYSQYDSETGQRRDSWYWEQAAESELGSREDWAAVKARAAEMKAAATLVGGYDSCFRLSGLDYLTALGYSVWQVL